MRGVAHDPVFRAKLVQHNYPLPTTHYPVTTNYELRTTELLFWAVRLRHL